MASTRTASPTRPTQAPASILTASAEARGEVRDAHLAGRALVQSRDVHREALAALAMFQQAVAREAAGAELVGRVAAFLDRARHDPGLRFDAEGGASA